MNVYAGSKVWITPDNRGRVIEVNNDHALVREDYRMRVDGTKRTPICEYARNANGIVHMIPIEELEYVGMALHWRPSDNECDVISSCHLNHTSE